MTRAESRFRALWQRLGGAEAAHVHAELARRYAEPQRHYHTAAHIHRCLRDFDRVGGVVPHPDTVELALWFHDLIYVPGACDNEARSAERLLEFADGRIACAAHAATLIRATTHCTPPSDPDTAYTVDIDLAGMGRDWRAFVRDGERLRAERPELADTRYVPCLRSFLAMLLARPRLYHTDFFFARCEARARANLARRLAQLGAAG